jgi:hypothetical protein
VTLEQPARSANAPPGERIEVHVTELKQLFDSMDPSPFRERDLDPHAEEFIVSWARELPRGAPLTLIVHVDRIAEEAHARALGSAINDFFRYRAEMTRRRLRELFRVGRISLVIGLVFLTIAFVIVNLLGSVFSDLRFGGLLGEGVLIGGWVAMWRPLEIFLYGWWPIRREAQLYDRLGAMPVRITTGQSESFADGRP